jgi:hypothetical protein
MKLTKPVRLDPSDAMSNFVHHMKSSTRAGFSRVEKLTGAEPSSRSLTRA